MKIPVLTNGVFTSKYNKNQMKFTSIYENNLLPAMEEDYFTRQGLYDFSDGRKSDSEQEYLVSVWKKGIQKKNK